MSHCSRCCFSNLIIRICNWWNQCGKNRNRQLQETCSTKEGALSQNCQNDCQAFWTCLPSTSVIVTVDAAAATAAGAVEPLLVPLVSPFLSLAWLFARVFERLTPLWVVFQELWGGFSSNVWSRVACMKVSASISKFAKACSMTCTGRLLCALSCYRARGNRLGNRSSFLLPRSSSLPLSSSRQS